jgi:hypothetical protein
MGVNMTPLRAARLLVSNALGRLPERHRHTIYDLIKRVVPGKRERVAARHLRGRGIEIGAMHNPLRVPPGVVVQYVDYFTPEENRERLSDIASSRLVKPDIVEDCFVLPSFHESSVDFVVANHVLEHSDNVLKTLIRWTDILRPGGVLYVSVPLAERCFDRGRPITTIEHFVGDLEADRAGDAMSFEAATREHYVEWVTISMPAILREHANVDLDRTGDFAKTAAQLFSQRADIHFHTFTVDSFNRMLAHFCAAIRPDFAIVEIDENLTEVIGVLQRKPTAAPRAS